MDELKQQVSIRDQVLPKDRLTSDVLRAIDVRSIEVAVDMNDALPFVRVPEAPRMSLTEAKQRFDREGVRISALLIATDFSADDADRHVNWAVRTVRAASDLSIPVVRIDTLTAKKSLPSHEVRDNFIRRVSEVLERTAQTGVDLGIENHGPLSNDPAFLDAVFSAVPDPRLGMTLDTGNFYWWGHPLSELYRLLEKYAPRAKHTHIKNINYPKELADRRREIGFEYGKYCCPLPDGNIDLHRVVTILRRAGYRRDFCIEDESIGKLPGDKQIEVLKRDVRALREAMT